SLRLRRDSPGDVGNDRLVVRVGDLPDSVVVDARPGGGPIGSALALTGRLQRVLVLSQSGRSVDDGLPPIGRRRDGTWLAVTDTGDDLDVVVDATSTTVTPSGPARVDLSMRDELGAGAASGLTIRQVQASVQTSSAVTFDRPGDGALDITVADGASGR